MTPSRALVHRIRWHVKAGVDAALGSLAVGMLRTTRAINRKHMADFGGSSMRKIGPRLKEHKIDVILVGLRYVRSMARDLHYQAIRAVIDEITKKQMVLRIGRYDAEETLEKLRRDQGALMSESEVTESSYVCMAEYLARAIAAGLFVKEQPLEAPFKHPL